MSSVQTPLLPRSVPLATGVSLQYVETGDPTGIPVVLLHGYTDSWRSFEMVLPHLPAEIRAFSLTLRGHGQADKPATGYHAADYAADVAAFLDALDLDRVITVGHSMGSSAAQRFAIDHPARCRGLVLIGSSATWRGNPGLLELWEVVAGLEDPLDPAFVHEFQASTFAYPIPEEIITNAVAESLRMPAAIWREALAEILAADFSHELGRIAAPTLLLAGGRDDLATPDAQVALQAAIPNSHLIVYTDGGHALHWEEPARAAADITAFVRELA